MRHKDKSAGPNCMAIDRQRRVCLSAQLKRKFRVRNGQTVYVTIGHLMQLLVFRRREDIVRHAEQLARPGSGIAQSDVELLLFRKEVSARLDQRGRIAIPENLLNEARLKDSVEVVCTMHMMILASSGQLDALCKNTGSRLRPPRKGRQMR